MSTHGTNGGYQGHRKRGEPACEACNTARRAYEAAYRERAGATLKRRAARRAAARNKALSRLAARYPDDYRELRLEALKDIPR